MLAMIDETTPINNDLHDDSQPQGLFGHLKHFCVSYQRSLSNIASAVGLAATGILYYLSEEGSSDYKAMEKTACMVAAGMLTRTIVQLNLDSKVMRMIHNFFANFSWETYLVLWNIHLNEPTEATLDAIFAFAGWHTIGNTTSAYHLTKEEGDQRIESIYNEKVVNHMLVPSYSNLKWQICMETAITTAGIGLTVFAYLYDFPGQKGVEAIGSFLATRSIGKGVIRALIYYLQRKERNRDYLQEFKEYSTETIPRESFWQKRAKDIVYLMPQFTPIIMVTPLFFRHAQAFFALGLLYGGLSCIKVQQIQVLTKEEFEARKNSNTHEHPVTHQRVINTSIIINDVVSVAFISLATAFGVIVIVLNNNADRGAISAFLGSELITLLLAILTAKKFEPEKSGRILTTLRHLIYENPYFLSLLYLSFDEITKIDDKAIAKDKDGSYAAAILEFICYGAMLISNRVRYTDLATRNDPCFTPPIYTMYAAVTIKDACIGKFDDYLT